MYCTVTDIRNLSTLTASNISDTGLLVIIDYAIGMVNSDINVSIEEQVIYIDSEKENVIDGDNKVFYATKRIGDKTNSGTITVDDVEAYTINDSVRTTYTVASIDDTELGKFTLASAPTTNEILSIKYMQAPIDEETPHNLVTLATAYLTIALANTKLSKDKYKTLRLGRLSSIKFDSDYNTYMGLYNKTIERINNSMIDTAHGKAITW